MVTIPDMLRNSKKIWGQINGCTDKLATRRPMEGAPYKTLMSGRGGAGAAMLCVGRSFHRSQHS